MLNRYSVTNKSAINAYRELNSATLAIKSTPNVDSSLEDEPFIAFLKDTSRHFSSKCIRMLMVILGRHVPGSQPSLSLNPDSDKKLERCCCYFNCSLHTAFSCRYHCPNSVHWHIKILRKRPKILPPSLNPGSRIRRSFRLFNRVLIAG